VAVQRVVADSMEQVLAAADDLIDAFTGQV
jgi:hypothetical protein